ncbi:MAG: hypothetical protein ACK587_10510 [Cyanobacteriota bacterium]
MAALIRTACAGEEAKPRLNAPRHTVSGLNRGRRMERSKQVFDHDDARTDVNKLFMKRHHPLGGVPQKHRVAIQDAPPWERGSRMEGEALDEI